MKEKKFIEVPGALLSEKEFTELERKLFYKITTIEENAFEKITKTILEFTKKTRSKTNTEKNPLHNKRKPFSKTKP